MSSSEASIFDSLGREKKKLSVRFTVLAVMSIASSLCLAGAGLRLFWGLAGHLANGYHWNTWVGMLAGITVLSTGTSFVGILALTRRRYGMAITIPLLAVGTYFLVTATMMP